MKQHRKPPRIDHDFTMVCREIANKYSMDIPDGFVLYGCHRNAGRCDSAGRITIPLWVTDEPEGMMIQYIAHEIAHAHTWLDTGLWHHNSVFMEWMMLLCPNEHWHYELSYKPRAAKAAGITKPT